MRAALQAGEDGLVKAVSVLGLTEQQAAARAAQGLMCCCRDDIGIGDGTFMDAGYDEPCDVGYVTDVIGACIFCYLSKYLEVDFPWVGCGS